MSVVERRLLTVLAHPDDESFGMGGTIAYYAAQGVKVYLICATNGDLGTVPPDMLNGFDSVAALRRHELQCAANVLKLSEVIFLGYRDSGMAGTADNHHPQALAAQNLEHVAQQIAEIMRQIKPQVVLTFDPIGGYKHPDHIAVHQATVRAFSLAGDESFSCSFPPYQPLKLYFNFFPRTKWRWTLKLMPLFGIDPRHYGKNKDINLVELIDQSNFPTHARINYRPVAKAKEQAAACHASQLSGGPPRWGIIGWLMQRNSTVDHFMRAYPPPKPGIIETDLFEGVD